MRNQKTSKWKIFTAAIVVIALGMALGSIFYPSSKDPEPAQTKVTPSASAPTPPTVLSQSIDKTPQSTTPDSGGDPAYSFEEALSKAQASCEQSGLQPGTTAFDSCTEQTISQYGH